MSEKDRQDYLVVPKMEKFVAQRKTLNLALTVYIEEFKDSIPSEIPLSQLPDQIALAKSMKDEILLNCSEFLETQISSQLKVDAAEARTGFIKFIKEGFKLLKDDEDKRCSTPAPDTSKDPIVGQGSAYRAKSLLVEKYTGSTVGEFQDLIDQLCELAAEPIETQLDLRIVEERAKTTQMVLKIVKRRAKQLISYAMDCDLVDECTKLEDLYRMLEDKEIALIKVLQNNKEKFGIVGEYNKFNELKYPTFSGEQTLKFDYYTFKEDWDACVDVKAPSRAEQLQILKRQSLTGYARAVCRHLTTLEAVFKHLNDIFGNAKELFNNRIEKLKRLGPCEEERKKKKKWFIEVRSNLTYLRDFCLKHDMDWTLYNHSIIAEIQYGLPEEDLESFIEKICERSPGRASKRVVFEMLLEFFDKKVAISRIFFY